MRSMRCRYKGAPVPFESCAVSERLDTKDGYGLTCSVVEHVSHVIGDTRSYTLTPEGHKLYSSINRASTAAVAGVDQPVGESQIEPGNGYGGGEDSKMLTWSWGVTFLTKPPTAPAPKGGRGSSPTCRMRVRRLAHGTRFR